MRGMKFSVGCTKFYASPLVLWPIRDNDHRSLKKPWLCTHTWGKQLCIYGFSRKWWLMLVKLTHYKHVLSYYYLFYFNYYLEINVIRPQIFIIYLLTDLVTLSIQVIFGIFNRVMSLRSVCVPSVVTSM